jgi:photosynthetic reaction center cytochrome c subunit
MKKRMFFLVVAMALVGLLFGYQRTIVVQRGYRGESRNLLYRQSTLDTQAKLNKFPKPLRLAKTDGIKASEAYENVQVLGDLTQSQMARLMLSIKAWVAPDIGCNFCHDAPNYASDEKYPKRVAREMLRMTRHINADWAAHIAGSAPTGVTCYTCHRGQPVPPQTWYQAPSATELRTGLFNLKPSVRPPTAAAGNTVLAPDALSEFLLGDTNIRVIGTQPLAGSNPHFVRQARDSYSLMIMISESLGVNCNFCHETRAFYSWPQSAPPRAQAWYGIRMVRDINNNYVAPLNKILPAERLGPTGDAPKVYCATCHLGSNKPLGGSPMLQYYPELIAPKAAPTAPPASVPASTSTAAPAPAAGPDAAATSSSKTAAPRGAS